MIKKWSYIIIGVVAVLFISYVLQPIPKGKGLSKTEYELVQSWLYLPTGFRLGNPTGMDLDTNQNLVVFHRADRKWPLFRPMPGKPIRAKTILIIDKESGKLIANWGNNLFIMPHGLEVDHENNIWVTDVGLHQIFKFSYEGKLLLKLGEAKVPGKDPFHFNMPTDVAVAPDGSFYVSDGYGNSRIVKFSASGQYLLEWGTKGTAPNQFNIPHGIALANNGDVYVADRENNRITVFDPNGKFVKQIKDKTFGAICAIALNKKESKLYAVDDFTFLKIKHRGSDVFIFDTAGKTAARFGRSSAFKHNTSWYHDLAVDNDENIYVGDILKNTIQKFRKVSQR